jgi:hypothetical protein
MEHISLHLIGLDVWVYVEDSNGHHASIRLDKEDAIEKFNEWLIELERSK